MADAEQSAEALIVKDFEAQQRVAKALLSSGSFSDIKGSPSEQLAKALVKIQLGAGMGFSPAQSMSDINLIQGSPVIGATLRAARMKAAGYSWRFIKHDDTECRAMIYGKRGEELGECAFTIDEAKVKGLAGKDNWKRNPKEMLFARFATRAQRWFAPEVLQVNVLDPYEAAEIRDVEATVAAPLPSGPRPAERTVDDLLAGTPGEVEDAIPVEGVE